MKAKTVFIRSALEKENENLTREKFALMRDVTKGLAKCIEGTLAMVGEKHVGTIKIDISEIIQVYRRKRAYRSFF
ncbi:MAG: hypothetical protein HXO45_11190 [Prevotella sp.]|nr:hypothetical protein [Prevotella sp.]